MTPEQAAKRYGPIVNGRWTNEKQWAVLYKGPNWLPKRNIYINKDIAENLSKVFFDIANKKLQSEIKTFNGSYNVRWIRGETGIWSMHSWAIALDWNALDMPLGSVTKWSSEFVKCWTDNGFVNGETFSRKDPQHFEWIGKGLIL
jgi:hypothetical protein